ncbi:acyl-CoA dehydrogenase family protein [Sphingomonas sp. IC4-52]|uniref:acyl-CoA dehydrogenase family protein n=1 Tax=Sphingomonas sp. IC4-52 TaxID=2887202 RepID=UPI001D1180A9|nr:acyl-CoA dehydrogenase family protein [Sphingomonas sp. IC4-52]MCC2980267.1 acyl-CoA/acyl-ACP dehydrogenase [Sphingomonas sp. IC4-52]
MRFHLSAEQHAIQDAVRRTLSDCWGIDRLHSLAEGGGDFDRQSWDALTALGIGGLALPAADGGAGLGLLEAALVSEIIGEAAAPGPIMAQMLGAIAVAASDHPEACALLPAIASGEKVVTLVSADGLAAAATSAALFLLLDDRGVRLVEAGDGISAQPVRSTDRSRPLSRADVAQQGHLLFPPGDPMAARLHDAALILIAADSLGGASRVTTMSVDYARQREQFGQPIGRFQGLKHQLAHMALEVEPARALVWYAAYAWDAQLPDGSRAAAIAKAHLCDVFTRSARAAVAAHGGIGYTWDYGLHYWLRRAIANAAMLGSPADHRRRAADLADWSAAGMGQGAA